MLVKHAKTEDRESCPFKDVINHRNKDGVNALFEAAKKDYSPIVHLLLEEGIDWSNANKDGVTALHAASWEGNPKVASALLAKAYSTSNREDFESFLNRRNHRGNTALLYAAERGRTQIVKQLLEKYDADFLIRDDEERSALNLACCEGHAEVVTFLLSFASTKLPRDRFVEFLNHRNKGGNTAMKDAAERGRLRCVEALLDQRYGADFRLDNVNAGTPLIRSSNSGYKEVVAALLKAARDRLTREDFQTFIDHRNKWGKTALMDAAENNRAPVINLLLAHDADFTLLDNNGFTALHYCAFRNHMAAVDTLLKGASQSRSIDSNRFHRFLNQQSKNNRATALRDAASQKHTRVAMLLLEYGPAYDAIDSGKRTALHHAVGRWDEEFAIKLLEYAGRDGDKERFRRFVNAGDESGDTAWKGAKRRGMQVLLQRLRACGVVEGAEFLG
ncbi:ankyrin repeat-containing domain protein [Usnea florida]